MAQEAGRGVELEVGRDYCMGLVLKEGWVASLLGACVDYLKSGQDGSDPTDCRG